MRLIDYMQEHVRLDKVRFGASESLLEALNTVVEIAASAKVEPQVTEATVLQCAINSKVIKLDQQFSLQAVQRYVSPEAIKLALQYAALKDPLADLWVTKLDYSPITLERLQTIDVLLAISGGHLLDAQAKFASDHRITASGHSTLLEQKRTDALKGFISAEDIFLQLIDVNILIYVAWISHQPIAIYPLHAFDSARQNKIFHITPAHAARIVTIWHEKFTKLHIEHAEQAKLQKIDPSFSFTPLDK